MGVDSVAPCTLPWNTVQLIVVLFLKHNFFLATALTRKPEILIDRDLNEGH
jgi:hypothetical protein